MKQRYVKTVGLAAGVVMVIVTSSLAWADGGHYWSRGHAFGSGAHGGHARGGMAHGMADHLLRHKQMLGLTDDQVAKLKELALNRDLARIRAHADVMVAAREVRALASDEKTELSAIEAKVNEQEALEGKLRMIGIKAKRDAYAVLTPEQREKLKALREQMRHGYRSHMMKTEAGEPSNDGNSSVEQTAGAPSSEHDTIDQAG
jgi:Spy/CpxP family protein refolding chaperone